MATPAMRPRRVGEILDAAIKLYTGNAGTLMGAVAVVVIPLEVVNGIILASVYNHAGDIATFSTAGTPTTGNGDARLGAQAISLVINLIGNSLVLAACVKAISDAYLGRKPDTRDSLRFGLRRLLPVIVLVVVRIVLNAFAFVLLIIPGIFLYVAWSVSVQAVVIERRGPFRALGRSFWLIRRSWWRAAAVLLVAEVVTVVVSALISGLLVAIALSGGNPSVGFTVLISTLAAIVSAVLLQPFSAAVSTVLYYDLRIRREGYDVEVMAEQLGISPQDMPGGLPPEGQFADDDMPSAGFGRPVGPEDVGRPGGPPYWPPPPGWHPGG